MPVIYNFKNNNDKVVIFQIEPADFPVNEKANILPSALSKLSITRLKQKQACLKLVSLFAGYDKKIYYDSHGKPFLANDNRHISFSHSGTYAAMMLSNHDAGIDFELIRPKVINIIHKFLNEAELQSLKPENIIEHAHIYWGAKEAIYKIYGKQQLVFKEQILLEPFAYKEPSGFFYGHLVAGNEKKKFTLFYKKMFGYMLVHVVNER